MYLKNVFSVFYWYLMIKSLNFYLNGYNKVMGFLKVFKYDVLG